MKNVILLLSVVVLCACGSESNNASNNGSTTGDNNGTTSGDNNGSTGGENNVSGDAVPATSDGMFAFLKAESYSDWDSETSGIHPSTGPHFGDVLTFVNPELATSLAAGNTEHPVGSASVKEFYGDDTTLDGWASMVKVSAGTSGDTWYWYEITNTETNTPLVEGLGSGSCTGCHSAGPDFIRTEAGAF